MKAQTRITDIPRVKKSEFVLRTETRLLAAVNNNYGYALTDACQELEASHDINEELSKLLEQVRKEYDKQSVILERYRSRLADLQNWGE